MKVYKFKTGVQVKKKVKTKSMGISILTEEGYATYYKIVVCESRVFTIVQLTVGKIP